VARLMAACYERPFVDVEIVVHDIADADTGGRSEARSVRRLGQTGLRGRCGQGISGWDGRVVRRGLGGMILASQHSRRAGVSHVRNI
jgi:hypothetical protein